jgi:hypothetical protein
MSANFKLSHYRKLTEPAVGVMSIPDREVGEVIGPCRRALDRMLKASVTITSTSRLIWA